MESIWVFNGEGATFPAAVFSEREKAELWVHSHKLSGVLTQYPVDVSVLDWAIEKGHFTPKGERHELPQFVQSFSSAHQAHYHYQDGRLSA
jgi:hypothetical protein